MTRPHRTTLASNAALLGQRLAPFNRWYVCALMTGCLICLTMFGLALDASLHAALARARDANAAASKLSTQGSAPVVSAASADFVAGLPSRNDVSGLLSALQRSCAASGVTMQEIRIDEHQPTLRELARAQVSLQLHGAYPSIKQVLVEVLGRFSTLTLHQLALRRSTPSAQDVDGLVTLTMWAEPLTNSSPSATSSKRPIHDGA